MENKTKYMKGLIYGVRFDLNNWAHLRIREGCSSRRILFRHITQPTKDIFFLVAPAITLPKFGG